jgi:hypothetical protein
MSAAQPHQDATASLLTAAAACIDSLGSPSFEDRFLTLLQESLHIEQCMLFAYDGGDRMECLLAANHRRPALAERLARQYVQGEFRRDPNYSRLRALPQEHAEARPEPIRLQAMSPAY